MNPEAGPDPTTSPSPRSGSVTRRRRLCSKQEIAECLAAWEASGLSLSAFARERDLQPSTLARWRRQALAQATALGFVEAGVLAAPLAPEPLTVRLAEGVELIGREVELMVNFIHRLRGGGT